MTIFDTLRKEKYPIKSIAKGKTLFLEGEKCDTVAFVLSGKIKISSFSSEGREIIYNIIEKEELFGNNLLFSSFPYYKGNVIALSDCSVIFLNEKELLDLLSEDQNFLKDYLEIHSNFSQKLNFRIRLLSLSSLKERFLFYLDSNHSHIQTSITSLAKELCVERESLSRLINDLTKRKVLIRQGKNITRNQGDHYERK